MIELSFHGAARTVTGSQYLVSAGEERLLVDCGMFQGSWDVRQNNWSEPRFDPATVPHLLLTHTHIDHCGLVPRLVRQGFRGRVVCTAPTLDLARILLADSARIQEEEASYRNEKGISRHKPALPLYTSDEVDVALKRFEVRPPLEWVTLSGAFRFRYKPVGHLLGAAMIELVVKDGARETTILFSGDVGRYGVPFTPDPEPPSECDFLVIESTYGDRSHGRRDLYDQVEFIVRDAFERNGLVLMPAFAVGRAQVLVYILEDLKKAGRLPDFEIYLDSPMAVNATAIYCGYPGELKTDVSTPSGGCLLYGRDVNLVRSREESIALNRVEKGAVIIASSGMLNGGRVMHHLRHVLPRAECTVVLGGYQPEGGVGRKLQNGAEVVRIHKREIPVRARIVGIEGLSGHADGAELSRWASGLAVPPKRTFVTHGELDAAEAMATRLRRERKFPDVRVPDLHETVRLA